MPHSDALHNSGKEIVADPVDGQAVMRYSLAQGGRAVIRVYDVSGRLVRVFDETRPAGTYGIAWDGRLGNGRRVPSGIYFYRVTLPDGSEIVRKTAILR